MELISPRRKVFVPSIPSWEYEDCIVHGVCLRHKRGYMDIFLGKPFINLGESFSFLRAPSIVVRENGNFEFKSLFVSFLSFFSNRGNKYIYIYTKFEVTLNSIFTEFNVSLNKIFIM